MRTWPASTSAAALVRAFTTRACHNHLSRRWRSKQCVIPISRRRPGQTPGPITTDVSRKRDRAPAFYNLGISGGGSRLKAGTTKRFVGLTILAVGGELLFQRRQFGKGRIGVDRAIAFARGRAGRVGPVRGPAIGPLVAAALVPAAIVAPTREFALLLIRLPALVFVPAAKPLARRTTLVILSRVAHRRPIGLSRGRL